MASPPAQPLARLQRVWLILMAATALSFAAYREVIHSLSLVALPIIGLAYFKARLVLLDFIELRHAPIGWRAAFEGWLIATSGVILTMTTLA